MDGETRDRNSEILVHAGLPATGHLPDRHRHLGGRRRSPRTPGDPWWNAIPFILLTLLLLALPVLLVVLLGKRAHVFLPKVRDWMNTHSWIVSEIVILFFTAITIHSLTS